MSGVFFCSATNSTFFTECCQCAICDDQTHCPVCGEEVPGSHHSRWNQAMDKFFGSKRVIEMRKEHAKKY